MDDGNEFGIGGRYHEILRHQRETLDSMKRLTGPAFELQKLATASRLHTEHLSRLATLGNFAALNLGHAEALKAIANPAWIQAIQATARKLNHDTANAFGTRQFISESVVVDALKLSRILETNRQAMATLMTGSQLSLQLGALNSRFVPELAAIKKAAEQAWKLDMLTLRASADLIAKSSVVTTAEHVLEAHRLVDSISQSETSEQFITHFATLLSKMANLFSRFGDNTTKELQGIGAIRLVELFMLVVAIWHFAIPADASFADNKIVEAMQIEIDALQKNLRKIIEATEAANENYVSNLPRAELTRPAPIRHDPNGKSTVLLRGEKGMLLAIRQHQDRWYQAVYRDPLSNQLSEGWVYASAVQLLDQKTE